MAKSKNKGAKWGAAVTSTNLAATMFDTNIAISIFEEFFGGVLEESTVKRSFEVVKRAGAKLITAQEKGHETRAPFLSFGKSLDRAVQKAAKALSAHLSGSNGMSMQHIGGMFAELEYEVTEHDEYVRDAEQEIDTCRNQVLDSVRVEESVARANELASKASELGKDATRRYATINWPWWNRE